MRQLEKSALLGALDHFPEYRKKIMKVGEDRLINDMKKKRKKELSVALEEEPLDRFARRVLLIEKECYGHIKVRPASVRVCVCVCGVEGSVCAQARRKARVDEECLKLFELVEEMADEVALPFLRGALAAPTQAAQECHAKIYAKPPPRSAPSLDTVRRTGGTQLPREYALLIFSPAQLKAKVEAVIDAALRACFVSMLKSCLLRVPFLKGTDEDVKDLLLEGALVQR